MNLFCLTLASILLKPPTVGARVEETILTARQVARYLKMSQASIYKLVRQGKIPAVRILNKWRFDKREVDRLFKQVQFTNKEKDNEQKT
jgi:excisionase family DNA binding protein